MAWLYSIKWKMSFGFVLLFLLIGGAYSSVTQRDFEAEKIRFLAESQRKEVARAARTFGDRADQARLTASSILSAYDFKKHKLTPAGEGIFASQPQLLAVEVREQAHNTLLFQLEKEAGLVNKAAPLAGAGPSPTVYALGSDQYVSVFAEGHAPFGDYSIKTVFANKELFMDGLSAHSLMLLRGNHVLKRNATSLSPTALRALLSELPRGSQARTNLKYNGIQYLISTARVPGQNLHFVSLVNENQAFGGWNPIFSRMITFSGIAFFLTLIFSVFAFRRLGYNVRLASLAAERMALGDFTSTNEARTYDEAGQLTETLKNIRTSVREKIAQTVTSTQNETVRIMSRNLLPRKAFYQNAHVRLFGLYKPAARQSRELWLYRQRGSELFVVLLNPDVSGTDAALMNSAVRSTFTSLIDAECSLKELARGLDRAVMECSDGQATARATLLQINVEFGEGKILVAGMAGPLRLRRGAAQWHDGYNNFRLGEGKGLWLEDLIELLPGERLLLFTRGFKAIGRRSSGAVSERLFFSRIQEAFSADLAPEALAYRMDALLPKENPHDITSLVLDFRARS